MKNTQLLAHEDFILEAVHLNPTESWNKHKRGLSFVFPMSGAGDYQAGDRAVRLEAGDALFLNAKTEGRISPAAGQELQFHCFSLCFEHLLPLFSSTELGALQTITDGGNTPRHYAAATPLALECHRLLSHLPPKPGLDQRAQLLRVASVLLAQEFASAQEQRALPGRAGERQAQWFGRLPASQILNSSIDELARQAGCGRRHLNRLFRRHYGFSVCGLKKEMRLIKAAGLLRDAGAKVDQVAQECGFQHLGRFHVWFRKRFGTSPAQWRKALLASELEKQLARPSFGTASLDPNSAALVTALGRESPLSPVELRERLSGPTAQSQTPEFTPAQMPGAPQAVAVKLLPELRHSLAPAVQLSPESNPCTR